MAPRVPVQPGGTTVPAGDASGEARRRRVRRSAPLQSRKATARAALRAVQLRGEGGILGVDLGHRGDGADGALPLVP